MSPEWRLNRSVKAKETWENEDHRAKMSEMRKGNKYKSGKPNSEKWHELTSARMKGNTHTLGYKHSEVAREKMRSRWQDPEWKAAMLAKRHASGMYDRLSERMKGNALFLVRKHSDETLAKMGRNQKVWTE